MRRAEEAEKESKLNKLKSNVLGLCLFLAERGRTRF